MIIPTMLITTFCLIFQITAGYSPADSRINNLMDYTFRPSWWCPGPHLQSIFAHFYRPVPESIQFKRERIDTYDGDFLDLDFVEGGDSKAPIVVLIHGLEESSHARYIRSLAGEANRAGWRAVAVNMRGCSGEINRKKYAYHAGRSEDLDCVVRYLIDEKGEREIYLAGFSIGGNIVLKWLGEKNDHVPPEIKKAAAVSVPFDLVKSTEILDQGMNRLIYTSGMLGTLKAKALEREKIFPGSIDREKTKNARTFMEFDREVTVRVNDLKDPIAYWSGASAMNFIRDVRVPSLVVHAYDDPFLPARYLPLTRFKESPYLKLVITPSGGHLGFVSGLRPGRQELWLENRIMEFFLSS